MVIKFEWTLQWWFSMWIPMWISMWISMWICSRFSARWSPRDVLPHSIEWLFILINFEGVRKLTAPSYLFAPRFKHFMFGKIFPSTLFPGRFVQTLYSRVDLFQSCIDCVRLQSFPHISFEVAEKLYVVSEDTTLLCKGVDFANKRHILRLEALSPHCPTIPR